MGKAKAGGRRLPATTDVVVAGPDATEETTTVELLGVDGSYHCLKIRVPTIAGGISTIRFWGTPEALAALADSVAAATRPLTHPAPAEEQARG